jgi:hypothetical protein
MFNVCMNVWFVGRTVIPIFVLKSNLLLGFSSRAPAPACQFVFASENYAEFVKQMRYHNT